MPYNNLTGPPKIVTDAGEELILPLPDKERFMKGDFVDESEDETQSSGLRRVLEKEYRNVFEFGYRALDHSKAADLVRIYETHPSFTFFPRTIAGSDTADEVSYRCRVTSDMPFVVRADGTFPVDLVIEQVGEISIASQGLIVLGINDSSFNIDGPGIYTLSIGLEEGTLNQLISLTSAEYPIYLHVINETRDVLFVKANEVTTVYKVNLDNPSTVVPFYSFSDGGLNETFTGFSMDENERVVYIARDGFFAGAGRAIVVDYDGVQKRIFSDTHMDGVAYIPGTNTFGGVTSEFWDIQRYNSITGANLGNIWRWTGFSPQQLVYIPPSDEFATILPVGNSRSLAVLPNVENGSGNEQEIVQGGNELNQLFYAKVDGKIYAANRTGTFNGDAHAYRIDPDGSNLEPVLSGRNVAVFSIGLYEPAGGTSVI